MNFVFKLYDDKEKFLSLQVGFDTLAHGFGTFIYCRVRDGKIECPYCGAYSYKDFPECFRCFFYLLVDEKTDNWAKVRVMTVLYLGKDLERFFFPREWNGGKPWISRADLIDKYIDFLSERYLCSTESIKQPPVTEP